MTSAAASIPFSAHRRPEIDGLRGLSALLVVAYHMRLPGASGGYIGVDIFFVISGFVISSLITERMLKGNFSPRDFLAGRIRRLYPPMLVVVLAALLGGSFFLGVHELERLAVSAIWSLGSAGNIHFWMQQGYFQDQVPEAVLLHLWSLGVEAQIYVLLPFLLHAMLKLDEMGRRLLIAFIFLVGVGVSLHWTRYHPGAAFYLPPARSWEFALGVMLAVVLRPAGHLHLRQTAFAVGGALIIVTATTYTRSTPYPGAAALLPAVGALLVLHGASAPGSAGYRILTWTPLRFVGGMSYSVYLWHWPVLSLLRQYVGRELSPIELILCAVVIFLLSYASWRLVERRHRREIRDRLGVRAVAVFSAICAAIALLSGAVLLGDGFPQRLNARAAAIEATGSAPADDRCHHGPPERVTLAGVCRLEAGTDAMTPVLIWGDSHANALSPAFRQLGREHGVGVFQASYSSCPPLLGVEVALSHPNGTCLEFNRTVLDAIARLGIKVVVLVGFWNAYLPERSQPTSPRFQ